DAAQRPCVNVSSTTRAARANADSTSPRLPIWRKTTGPRSIAVAAANATYSTTTCSLASAAAYGHTATTAATASPAKVPRPSASTGHRLGVNPSLVSLG